jgi:plasmid stabilization system protein ParE
MSQYFITPPARQDLLDIWTFLADHADMDRADKTIEALQEAMRKLGEMPGIGHRRDDLADESLRVFPVYSYLVIYRAETSPLQVIRVLHGARDLEAIFGEAR